MTCENCGNVLTKGQKRFCSHTCRAKVVNAQREVKRNPNWHRPLNTCNHCGQLSTYEKFCSRTCRSAYNEHLFRSGMMADRATLRKYLMGQQAGCFDCNLSEWRGKPLPLELDHIDGNASNNSPNNLRMLCPNCHSTTPTWKARNKGSGRKTRGMRVN